jgi:hypothetical protein
MNSPAPTNHPSPSPLTQRQRSDLDRRHAHPPHHFFLLQEQIYPTEKYDTLWDSVRGTTGGTSGRRPVVRGARVARLEGGGGFGVECV